MALIYTPFIAAFMTFVLALMAWLNRHHDRMQNALGLLMFSLSAVSVQSFIMQHIATLETYRLWLKLAILINNFEFYMIVYFVLVLTGYIDRKNEKVAGITLNIFLKSLPPLLLFFTWFLGFTDNFIKDIYKNADGSIGLSYSIWMIPVEIIAILCIVFVIVLLYRAYRNAPKGHYKIFLRSISTGLFIILFGGPLLGILLPMAGVNSSPLVDVSIVVASVIFYLAINRYQYDTITELNINLERKVIERTRHLHEAQSQLVQSEKMASMGRLVAGFAHEINNPIGAVQSTNATLGQSLTKLKDTLGKSDKTSRNQSDKILDIMQELVRVNGNGAKRVGDMVQKMKSFIQLDESELQQSDIHAGIDTTIELFSAKSDNNISFLKNYSTIPPVYCYPAKLNQVYWQLFDNAQKSMNGQGSIHIQTSMDKNNVIIEIADTGKGIAEKDLPNIFEPGFTNWDVGVGVGLGLSICYQIIQEHKGTISVNSDIGKGSIFIIKLPQNK